MRILLEKKTSDKCIIALCLTILMSAYVTIKVPISGTSQSTVGLCVFDIIFIFLVTSRYKYLIRSKYVTCLKWSVLNICVGGVIALLHFIFNHRSPVEFIGIIRNLYFYSAIYCVFSCICNKKQINTALTYFFFINTSMFLFTAIVANIAAEYVCVHSLFPDHWYVAVCGLFYLPFYSQVNKRLVILNQVSVISAALLVGSRMAFIISTTSVVFLLLYALCDKSFEYKKKWAVFVVSGVGCVLVLCASCLDDHLVKARCQRAGNVISLVYLMVNGAKSETGFINESHVRSDLYRNRYKSLVMESVKCHPFFGEGKRIIEDLCGNKLYIHNFMYQIMYTFGIPYLMLYLCTVLYLFRGILLNKECVQSKMGYLLSIGVLYTFALVQPSVTGGPVSNIVIWLIAGLGMDRDDDEYTTER